ncbi:VanZ family protein [Candidatus Methylacidithermus pantelleriae]|uniref:VanZ-like domain-containing protein n=1 Tax=Candidatus Methylacidithermus pantelleriae TaxID=2744239 RepID=A0A8J2BK84_9BACT|nr:VanZ family protein [Candidatus Methylacidithermus pantelleriae]CAF0699147.1 hypothetical protein MPNT_30140 [Candidatus Methylacidithermus pantelleriae]
MPKPFGHGKERSLARQWVKRLVPQSKQGWARLFVSFCLLLLLSTVPAKNIPGPISRYDKLCHGLLYFGVTLFLSGGLTDGVTILGSGLLLGAVDENYQRFTGRCPSLEDWVADALGVGLATLLVSLRRKAIHNPWDNPKTKDLSHLVSQGEPLTSSRRDERNS